MVYNEIGNFKILEENGLKVRINYDSIINGINEELSNSYVYEQSKDEDGNLYYFGKKDLKLEDYKKSLEDIKNLIDNLFTNVPTLNIFDFVELTKKGKFRKNQVVNLATPVVGIFRNYDYYKYVEYFCLSLKAIDESLIEVTWNYIQSDVKKCNPIFFEDYSTPIIREKLKSIRKDNLKVGHIYSDENRKSFYLYLGEAYYYYETIYKDSKKPLPKSSFKEEDFMKKINKRIKDEIADSKKYSYEYDPYRYLYIKLTKKEVEKIINEGSTIDFETFINGDFGNIYLEKEKAKFYSNPKKVFHDEFEYLEDFTKISKLFIENPTFNEYTGRAKGFNYCSAYYISWE